MQQVNFFDPQWHIENTNNVGLMYPITAIGTLDRQRDAWKNNSELIQEV